MTDHEETTGAGDAAAGGAARAPGGRWQVSISSVRGAAHLATGQPNQDAAARQDVPGPGGAIIVAVADGHGHSRHFRSGSGSLLAVDTACQVAAALTAGLARRAERAALSHAEVDTAVRGELAPALVREWRAAVAAHLAGHPFTPEEQSRLDALGDDPEIPYGATLLVVTIVAHWLICAQIGDGDMLAIRPDGQSFGPVPPGEKLGGERTRSLCQPDALAAFRVGVHDLVTRPLVALLLATDGYGNSQTADPWQPGVGRDLARFAAEHDHGWFERQVPGWAQRCASPDGSGDDTTIALLVHPDPAAAGLAARQVPVSAAADQATAETVPAGLQPGAAPALAGPAGVGLAGAGQAGAGPPAPGQPETGPVATVEIDLAGAGPHPDTLRIDPVPADRPPAGPAPAGPAPAGPAPAGPAPAGPVRADPVRADPAVTVEQTLPIRKNPPSGGRGAGPPLARPAPPPAGRAGSPPAGRAGSPAAPPGPPRVPVPGSRGSGSGGPGSGGPGSRSGAESGLRPAAGITSSRRTAVMIAGAIALAVVAAIVVVLLALRPAARPAPGPARHVQPASHATSASRSPQGQARQGHKAGRSAGQQHEGDG